MTAGRTNWILVVGCAVLVGLLIVACVSLLWLVPARSRQPAYRSNGEQIYFSATSQRGTPISFDLTMGMMRGGQMACVSCHGPDGTGRRARMMMRVFEAPDIRYETLISSEHGHEGEERHEAYTDEDIKRAITEGREPSGELLDWPMPRWRMSGADLDDLLDFLKTLE